MSVLTGLNVSPQDPPTVSVSSDITIHALPGRNIWRMPPATESKNGTSYVQYGPIQKFKRAQVTVDANWARIYDHGGLVFYINSLGLEQETYESWIKVAVEQFDGKPYLGAIVTPAGGYSDWSMVPLSHGVTSATIEVTRDLNGSSLYAYHVEGDKKTMIRQITWVFQEKHDKLLGVGVYGSRPTRIKGEPEDEVLAVHFNGLKIEWSE